jgi:hypothetical protein
MGTTAFLLASTGVSLLKSVQEQKAAEDQFEAENKEFTRQQEEANLIAQERKSERALAADKQFASMVASMESLGGAGSQDEARLAAEIGGNAGLDLSRIEGNRRREVKSLQASKGAARETAQARIKASQLKFLGSVAKTGSTFAENQADADKTAGFVSPGNPHR